MPNPRDRLKFTGDTRLPDVGEEDEMIVEEVLVVEAVVPVQEEPGAASRMQPPSAQHHWLDAAREQVREPRRGRTWIRSWAKMDIRDTRSGSSDSGAWAPTSRAA